MEQEAADTAGSLVPSTAAPLREMPDVVLLGPAAALVVHVEACDEHEEPIIYVSRRQAA